jgi:hypothetical protein
MTLGPKGNCSAFSAWQSASPAYDSPDSSAFVSRDAVVAERAAALAAPLHGRAAAAGARLPVFLDVIHHAHDRMADSFRIRRNHRGRQAA